MYTYPPQRPPSKGTAGCTIAILVVVVLACVVGGACVVCVAIGANRSATERKHIEAVLDAEAATIAANERAACDAAVVTPLLDQPFIEQCHDELRKAAYPDTLTFPSRGERVISPDGCLRELDVMVSRARASGATVHQLAICTYDPRTRLVKYTLPP